ncbi:MAG: glutathione S-transferase [Woeseiaceae bacterium]|nr:glutathione S-transferase [Woeseiaceae bacterium]
MLTVHHLENSRSQRILWLLEELGVEYDIKRYGRDKQTSLAPPELQEVHPLGKAPVIEDDGQVVAESGAIVEYLVGRYDDGTLLPEEGTPERMAYTYWLHYAESSLMPLLLMSLIMTTIETKAPALVRPIARKIAQSVRDAYLDPNLDRHLGFVESTLQQSTWLCGEQMTAADCQMSFAIEAAEVRTGLRSDYPHLAAFLDRIRARPAYKAALDRGGHYELMGG